MVTDLNVVVGPYYIWGPAGLICQIDGTTTHYFHADGQAAIKLRRGDMFGEVALVSKLPRNAPVRAVTAMDVVVVSREAFQEMLGNLPGLSVTVEQIMSARMSRVVDLQKEVADAMSSMNQA